MQNFQKVPNKTFLRERGYEYGTCTPCSSMQSLLAISGNRSSPCPCTLCLSPGPFLPELFLITQLPSLLCLQANKPGSLPSTPSSLSMKLFPGVAHNHHFQILSSHSFMSPCQTPVSILHQKSCCQVASTLPNLTANSQSSVAPNTVGLIPSLRFSPSAPPSLGSPPPLATSLLKSPLPCLYLPPSSM